MREGRSNILKVVCNHVERVLPKNWWHEIADYRYRKSTQWNLGYVLEVLMAGALTGCKTLREIETLSEMYEERIPDTTLHDIMVRLNPESLKQQLAKGVKQALREHELPREEFPIRITAVDGKTIYVSDKAVNENSDPIGGGGDNKMFRHMALRAFYVSSETKLMLGQRDIPCKGAETIEVLPLIDELLGLYGNTELLEVLSFDAGMVSKKNAAAIVERGLSYIMALKNPQQRLYAHALELFAQQEIPCCKQEEVYNGKNVERLLFRAVPTETKDWEHLQEFWKVVSISTNLKTGVVETYTRYFMTNISTAVLSNKQVLQAVRMHWGIENNANWCLDVNWFEDTAPWTSKAMTLVAYIRMIAYNIISRLKTRRLKAQYHRQTSWNDFFRYFEHALCQLRQILSFQSTAVPAFLS